MVYEFTATDDTKYFFGLHLVSSDDYRYVLNAHGDVIALVSKTGSTVAKYYEYDAFGNEINPDSSDTNPYRYCGEYYDFESGTIYLRARYYSPMHGRFTQVDPAKAGANWYSYCSNNPILYIDPSGFFDYDSSLSVYGDNNYDDVCALQRKLYELGYLSGEISDGHGVFGSETLRAINEYKSANGISNSGNNQGIVQLDTWKSLGLIYRTERDIEVGITIVTVSDGTQYKDVSVPVNAALDNAVIDFSSHKLDFLWFYDEVKTGGAWDIKLEGNWNAKIASGTYPGSYDTPIIYNGKITTPEALGNITYGYLGSAAGFSSSILLMGGDAAANGVSLSFNGIISGITGIIKSSDSAYDKQNIIKGINLYARNSR